MSESEFGTPEPITLFPNILCSGRFAPLTRSTARVVDTDIAPDKKVSILVDHDHVYIGTTIDTDERFEESLKTVFEESLKTVLK
jgi:hypothetical protein